MFHPLRLIPQILATAAICGCASIDPKPDYDRAAAHVENALGEALIYRPEDEELIRERVDDLLRDGLTVREAVQASLLNNPRLQAEFFEIGVARAEFVQSGLLSNPVFSFAPRWPDGGGLSNLQLGLAQNIAELWQIPFRKRAAERDLDRTLLNVAREASWAAYQTRLAYYRVLQAEQAGTFAGQNVQLTQRLVELAIGRRDAGAGSELDVQSARAQHAEAKALARTAAFTAVEARATLAGLLGLILPLDDLRLVERLPQPSGLSFSADALIDAARQARLDWKAGRMAVESAAARIDYERSRIFDVVELGVSAERNAQWSKGRGGGIAVERSSEITPAGLMPSAGLVPRTPEPQRSEWVVGPSLNLELPIFDQNQAQIVRAEFVHRQALKLVDGIERDVFKEAQVASARLEATAGNARLFGEEIVPLRERVLVLAEDAYNAGRSTFLSVVQAQQALQEARAGYADALRECAAAIVEIERVAGCPHERILPSRPLPDPDVVQSQCHDVGTIRSIPVETER